MAQGPMLQGSMATASSPDQEDSGTRLPGLRVPFGDDLCDGATEALLYFLVVFTPWAFGTNEMWSMAVADAAAYTMGLLLVLKWLVRRQTGSKRIEGRPIGEVASGIAHARLTVVLAVLTLALLGYVLLSAVNARATYDWSTNTFTYHDCIAWLPHSYDSSSTWLAFWNYLAWAAFFWAVRDWLLNDPRSDRTGPAARERSSAPEAPLPTEAPDTAEHRLFHRRKRGLPSPMSGRLRRLLWVVIANGALLALEGLMQQTTGTTKLLWIRDTTYNREADAQFGPFPYRANGAAYLNLIWPLALGYWWSLHRSRAEGGRNQHHTLLACLLVMIVGPLVSLSRGAALVTGATVVLSVSVLLLGRLRGCSLMQKFGILLVLAGAVAGGLSVGWEALASRMKDIGASYAERERMTEVGRRMAAENPVYGTGAETLQPLYQFYMGSPDEFWPGQLHNDWMETRVTFGWIGFCMILTALLATLLRWFLGGDGIRVSWRFVSFVWIAMAGCLVHARWDLPFQVYSIVLLFLLDCAILLCLSRKLS